MPRAVIFDLDGTLAKSKSPLESAVGELLEKLAERVPVAVMSGGSYKQFGMQFLSGMPIASADRKLYLFPDSAAQCYVWEAGEWKLHYDNSFSDTERAKIMQALHDALAETGFDTPPEQLWGEQTEDRGAEISWSALGQEAPYEVKKDWDPDRKKRTPLAASLQKRLPDFSIRMNASNTIDITRAGITKAYGIRQFSEMLTIPVFEMLYVGDALFPGGNDEVVKITGVRTQEVKGPEDTARVIEELLRA